MSLKAKLEAVIYAAEEPVTLAQLAQLFADEALEWKAAQEAAAQAQAAAAQESTPAKAEAQAEENAEFDALLAGEANAEQAAEVLEKAAEAAEQEAVAEEAPAASEESAAAAEGAEPQETEDSGAETGEETVPAEAGEAESAPAELGEAELKRLARQRDKEVRAILKRILDELVAQYASDDRGVEIREIAGGYRMATKPECHDMVRAFVKSLKPPLKLSLPALETLAVIAYKQPVTAPEVNDIRGVDSSGVFGSLLARKLIVTAGRKQVIGRPILYKTTKEFLLRFGLKDVSELPSMEEFEKMAAAELEEPEAAGGAEATAEAGDEAKAPGQEAGEDTAPETAPAESAEGESNTIETEPASSGSE